MAVVEQSLDDVGSSTRLTKGPPFAAMDFYASNAALKLPADSNTI
jgi:hypothetical protein